MKSVATLYRWALPESDHGPFIAHWRAAARELRWRGATACLLMRAESGELVGLIRWPSEFVRSAALAGKDADLLGNLPCQAARLTVEDSQTAGPTIPLGLAL